MQILILMLKRSSTDYYYKELTQIDKHFQRIMYFCY